MTYSNIKNVRIKNFKNLGDVAIDMSDCPIISLKGDNEAGKSSIIDAIAVAACHIYERDQKGFIREGTNGFGIQIELEDGTKVGRVKRTGGGVGTYDVYYPDGTQWSAQKVDAGEGAPQPVREVMGMIIESETKELLHIRTYNDQRLFISTPASANYKVMYEALKVENISRAIKRGSQEANELKAWVENASIRHNTLRETLQGLKIFDIAPALAIRDRLKTRMISFVKVEDASRNSAFIEQSQIKLGAYREVVESGIEEVNILIADKLVSFNSLSMRMQELDKRLQVYGDVNSACEINLSVAENLKTVLDTVGVISERERVLAGFSGVESMQEVDFGIAYKLMDCQEVIKRYQNGQENLNKYNGIGDISEVQTESIKKMMECLQHVSAITSGKNTMDTLGNEMHSLEISLKDCGVKVVVCPTCKNDIAVQLDQ